MVLSEVARSNVRRVVEDLVHKNYENAYRSGEIFDLLHRNTQDQLRSPTGLMHFLREHSEEFELDELQVKFPPQANGPADGRKTVFFSVREIEEPVSIGRDGQLGKGRGLSVRTGLNLPA